MKGFQLELARRLSRGWVDGRWLGGCGKAGIKAHLSWKLGLSLAKCIIICNRFQISEAMNITNSILGILLLIISTNE